MTPMINRVLARTLAVASSLTLLVSSAMADMTPMNGDTMGNGHWYSTGGFWLPAFAVVVVGAVLFAVPRKRH